MPEYDPELVDEVRTWLRKANLDLRAGELLLSDADDFLGDVAFHAQQAAEKAIKAFRTWHSLIFRKTHNIEELSGDCIHVDATLSHVLIPAFLLTDYAWKFRYPGEPENPTRPEAVEAMKLARGAVEAIEARLPEEVRYNKG